MDFEAKQQLDNLMESLKTQFADLRDVLLSNEGLITTYKGYSVKKERDARIVKEFSCVEHAVDALFDIHCKDPLNTKEVNLYPGLLLLNANHANKNEVITLANAINSTKDKISFFLGFHNKPKKINVNSELTVKVNPVLFELYPMINPSQLFRHINLIDKPVRKAKFTWSKRQRYDKYSVDKALNILAYNYDKVPALDISPNKWRNILDKAKLVLNALPADSVITRIKASPPAPILSCAFDNQSKWDYYHASMPTILFNDNKEGLTITGHLMSLPKLRGLSKDDLVALGWKPVADILGFYLK